MTEVGANVEVVPKPSQGDEDKKLKLTLLDELILALLNEESGYFRQVPGWNLNCAVVGGALAELSLLHRIDTDLESLILLDKTPTGDPTLDPLLVAIGQDLTGHDARYWIERLVPHAETIIDAILGRLVDMQILNHHEGEFWSLAKGMWGGSHGSNSEVSTAADFVKTRISRAIFTNEIPGPRDVIIICLIDTCGVLQHMFELEDEDRQRLQQVLKMDLIGRAIAKAVRENMAGQLFQRSTLAKKIPRVSFRKLMRNPHVKSRNIPALFADLYQLYGPVFEIKPPFREPLLFLAGPDTNHWFHRHGRMYLRARDIFEDFEKVYGAAGLLPGLDGADHFRFRKSVQPAYSRTRLEEQLDRAFLLARREMSKWTVGEPQPGLAMCRHLINASSSQLFLSIDSQDVLDDMCKFKARALSVCLGRTAPKFMLNTPPMKRRAKLIGEVTQRVQSVHTPAQRTGCPRDLADEFLNMHLSDRQFLPESNLSFFLTAPLLAGMYMGDQFSFALYWLLSQPEYLEQVRTEADALFAAGDPSRDELIGPKTDVTSRFLMEVLRMYPIVPMSVRHSMNAFTMAGYELAQGTRVHIASTATHYLEACFPEPFKFDIDRYAESRKEHLGFGYAPYGLGTHTCLGSRYNELLLAINLLLLVFHFDIEIAPKNYKFKISPFPSGSVDKKLKLVVTGQRNPLVP